MNADHDYRCSVSIKYVNGKCKVFEASGEKPDFYHIYSISSEEFIKTADRFQIPPLDDELTVKLALRVVKIEKISHMPKSLVKLILHTCCLSEIPELPETLRVFNCGNNPDLTSLPRLPIDLTDLFCSWCNIAELPELPLSLTNLECRYNVLESLPVLPRTLRFLNAADNNIKKIQGFQFPASVEEVYLSNNKFEKLPAPPFRLRILEAYNNKLSEFPEFPRFWEIPAGSPTVFRRLDFNLNPLTNIPRLNPQKALIDFIDFDISLLGTSYKVNVTNYDEILRHYLVILKLIKYLNTGLRIPADITKYLLTMFVSEKDLKRLA